MSGLSMAYFQDLPQKIDEVIAKRSLLNKWYRENI